MAFENLKSTGIAYLLGKIKTHLEATYMKIADAVKSVNGIEPDEDGDITLNTVPYAQNLESESSKRVYDTFIQRTGGGEASVANAGAWLMNVKGNSEHEGFTPESLTMTVSAVGEPPITATIDHDTFVEAVSTSGTTTLVYSSSWSADPANYGVTVTGTPVAGDTITIVYVKEVRGTITVADPRKLIATGWNLYNHTNGYAKVVKYEYGYRIDGTYTALQYSATVSGEKTDVTVVDGSFDITADGYIWVTDGSASDTAIYMTWEDWTEGHDGDFAAYTESAVDMSAVMASKFPYGLLKVGSVVDEIDLNLGQTISRVERLEYNSTNLATAKASGREYEYDENYIYLERASAVVSSVTINGSFTSNDHGIEFFTNTEVGVDAETLYGVNLKNKLEREVLTMSQQTLTSQQKAQVRSNIGVPKDTDVDAINTKLTDLFKYVFYETTVASLADGAGIRISANTLGVSTPAGYKPFAIGRYTSGSYRVPTAYINIQSTGDNYVIGIFNSSGSEQTNIKVGIGIVYIKNGMGI